MSNSDPYDGGDLHDVVAMWAEENFPCHVSELHSAICWPSIRSNESGETIAILRLDCIYAFENGLNINIQEISYADPNCFDLLARAIQSFKTRIRS